MYEEIFNQIRSAANKRNLKDSTIHAYCTSVAHFLNHTAKDIDALTTDDVDIFLTEKKLSGISPETYNHYHSGIRFFYKKILKKNWDDDDIPRMKRDRKLPTVLTKTEISAILDATPNLKHKAMIATMYSGGLRVSEVTHLHYDDISRTNKTIHMFVFLRDILRIVLEMLILREFWRLPTLPFLLYFQKLSPKWRCFLLQYVLFQLCDGYRCDSMHAYDACVLPRLILPL